MKQTTATISTKQAALDYLERGLPITLCAGKDLKAPLGHGYTSSELGDRWQTFDWTAEEIERAFKLRKNLNVGLRFGPGSCIDCEADSEDEERAFQELFDGCTIPPTPTFRSKRGGHRLFAWSEVLAVPGKAVLKFHGLGIRVGAGKGAHSCVPPSVNTDGTTREWIVSPDDCPFAPLSDIVLRRILEANKPEPPAAAPIRHVDIPHGDKAAQARRYLAKVTPSVEGQRGDDQLYHAACLLVLDFDLSPDEAWPLIAEWNLTCEPPWDEKRLRRKLNEADKQPGERGGKLRQRSERRPQRDQNDHLDPEAAFLQAAAEDEGYESNGEAAHGLSNTLLRSPTRAVRPEVQLPGGDVTITSAGERFGKLLSAGGRFYSRGGVPMRLAESTGEPKLEIVRPAALCSDLETIARLVRVQKVKDTEQAVPATCSESAGRLILESAAFRAGLPPIQIVSRSAVLIERGGKLVQVTGYDRESGILAGGGIVPDVGLFDAVALLNSLVEEFRFATPGDRARALASIVTPGLIFGGLLGARAPIDLGEADESQSGKGYRVKLTGAVYRNTPRMVTQRATGGVGSVQETFDAWLVSGACMISFDNFRGRLDLPGLESFQTEDTYPARVPYAAPVAVDPRRIIVMLTSNAAEVTPDLANRCSCVRILKQPADYEFKRYSEGDLLDYVLANQPRYLGAVFAVIREWHRLGKPELTTVDHDFRRWARVLGWITENILGAGGLLVGHRAAQQRIASPGLTWLRDVAIAVLKAKPEKLWLRPHHLLTIIVEAGIDTQGIDPAALDDESWWLKATQAIGRKLGKLFRTSKSVTVDNIAIERREVLDDQYRPRTEFAFFPQTPNNPE